MLVKCQLVDGNTTTDARLMLHGSDTMIVAKMTLQVLVAQFGRSERTVATFEAFEGDILKSRICFNDEQRLD